VAGWQTGNGSDHILGTTVDVKLKLCLWVQLLAGFCLNVIIN